MVVIFVELVRDLDRLSVDVRSVDKEILRTTYLGLAVPLRKDATVMTKRNLDHHFN